jgi:hypothetical protein
MKDCLNIQNEPESPAPKTPLCWYQYRLRTLLIIMTVLAFYMAIISHRARQQKRAVENILALRGTLMYDYQRIKAPDWSGFDPQALPPGPVWLRNFIGDNYFQSVVQVDLSNTSATDDDLVFLENLPELEEINLHAIKITSKGLVHLDGMRKLRSLVLWDTAIDDKGLVHLTNLTELQFSFLVAKRLRMPESYTCRN